MAVDLTDFARQELEAFFRRREVREKSSCAACLAERLTRRGSSRVAAAWTTVVANAFERPDPLPVNRRWPCEACQQLRPSIGTPRAVYGQREACGGDGPGGLWSRGQAEVGEDRG